MLIGQLAQRTGFTRDTIRFYEKHGLIQMPHKARRENNYKEYPDAAQPLVYVADDMAVSHILFLRSRI